MSARRPNEQTAFRKHSRVASICKHSLRENAVAKSQFTNMKFKNLIQIELWQTHQEIAQTRAPGIYNACKLLEVKKKKKRKESDAAPAFPRYIEDVKVSSETLTRTGISIIVD